MDITRCICTFISCISMLHNLYFYFLLSEICHFVNVFILLFFVFLPPAMFSSCMVVDYIFCRFFFFVYFVQVWLSGWNGFILNVFIHKWYVTLFMLLRICGFQSFFPLTNDIMPNIHLFRTMWKKSASKTTESLNFIFYSNVFETRKCANENSYRQTLTYWSLFRFLYAFYDHFFSNFE